MARIVGRELRHDIRRIFSDLSSAGIMTDMVLVSKDNLVFRCHSLVLRKVSRVLDEKLKRDPKGNWEFRFAVDGKILGYAVDLMYMQQVVYPLAASSELDSFLNWLGVKYRSGMKIVASNECLLEHTFLVNVDCPRTG